MQFLIVKMKVSATNERRWVYFRFIFFNDRIGFIVRIRYFAPR